MFNTYLFEFDIAWHAEKVQMDYAAAQRPVSFQQFRAAVGHAIIRIGTTIQGKAREACEDCAEAGSPLVNAGAMPLAR